jgi:hypothetical protein
MRNMTDLLHSFIIITNNGMLVAPVYLMENLVIALLGNKQQYSLEKSFGESLINLNFNYQQKKIKTRLLFFS